MTFFDFHTALATPAALVAAGIDGPRTFHDSSEIVCIDGRPTGELREGAVGLVVDVVPMPTGEERLAVHRRHAGGHEPGRPDRHPHDGRHARDTR